MILAPMLPTEAPPVGAIVEYTQTPVDLWPTRGRVVDVDLAKSRVLVELLPPGNGTTWRAIDAVLVVDEALGLTAVRS